MVDIYILKIKIFEWEKELKEHENPIEEMKILKDLLDEVKILNHSLDINNDLILEESQYLKIIENDYIS